MSLGNAAGHGIDARLAQLVDREIEAALPWVTDFRRERHRQPELSWQERRTAEAVAAALATLEGLIVRRGVAKTGLVAVIEGGRPGPTIGLRADMDALPITEASGKPHASQCPGVMHACGHDGHMANLLGSLRVLSRLRHELRGRVVALFQPAEEGGGGGAVMVDEGVLREPRVDAIFGLHGWPELPCGHVGLRPGVIFSSTTTIRIRVSGTGCHAAFPHLGTDQILIAARIIDALQAVRARVVPPAEPFALTIGKFQGGTTTNVIPPEVTFEGTIRASTLAVRDRAVAAVRQLVQGVAAAHGAVGQVEFEYGYPPTVNEPGATRLLERLCRGLLPAGHVHAVEHPSLGGEDFAYFLQEIPGSYFFLGMDDGRAGGYPSLHHPAYDFNDAALPVGMRLFSHLALGFADLWTGP